MAVVPRPAFPVAGLRAIVVLTLGLVSCEHVTFTDIDRITPPDLYRGWWAETTACVGRPTAAFERVTWFTVTRISEGEAEFGGYWRAPHQIYLRVDQALIGNVVRHEMVHDLLQLGSHNSPYFEVCVSGEG